MISNVPVARFVLGLMLVTGGHCVAEDQPQGLYAIRWTGEGKRMDRADTPGEVVLDKQLSGNLREASLISVSNDNSNIRLDLTAGPIPKGTEVGPLAIVVAGLCIPTWGRSDRKGDGSIGVEATFNTACAGPDSIEKIATALGVAPVLRKHPGHRILSIFRPKKYSYAPGESVTLLMTMRNVGDTQVLFIDGGSQRGPRNNQFGFTVFRNRYEPIPDTGDPRNSGGKGGFLTLAPGAEFTKAVDLSHWFNFDKPGSYEVTGMYHFTVLGKGYGLAEALWDDFAVGTCVVNITDGAEK